MLLAYKAKYAEGLAAQSTTDLGERSLLSVGEEQPGLDLGFTMPFLKLGHYQTLVQIGGASCSSCEYNRGAEATMTKTIRARIRGGVLKPMERVTHQAG